MSISLEAIAVPLHEDEDGGLRVGDTRVQLDRIIAARQQGATPENIVDMYPSLALEDVYAVVTWMLRHSADVEAYRQRRERQANELKQKLVDAGVGRLVTREDLEAMRKQQGQADVPPAD